MQKTAIPQLQRSLLARSKNSLRPKVPPQKGRLNFIPIFIGGKDLLDYIENSSKEPQEVADEIEKLDQKRHQLANFVYVAIPPRENDPNKKQKQRTI